MMLRSPRALFELAARFLGGNVTRAVAWTVVLLLGSGVVAFAMLSMAARTFSAADFGHLAMWLSVCQMGSVLALFGQEMFVLRSLHQYTVADRPDLAKGALLFSSVIGAIVPVLLALAMGLIGTFAFGEKSALMAAAAIFLVANSIAALCTHIAKYCVNIFLADGMRELFWRFLVVIALLAIANFHLTIQVYQFFLLTSAAIAVALIIQTSAIWIALPSNIRDAAPSWQFGQWFKVSVRFWVSTVLETINQYFDVVIIYWLLDPVSAGAYFVASRLANTLGTVLTGVHSYATRQIPALYFAGKTHELNRTLKLMSEVVLLCVAGGFAVIAFGAEPILGLFSQSFKDQKWTLIILATGTAIYAAGGPAAAVLMIAGHEGRYPVIIAANMVLRFIGFALLIPAFGLKGAALSTAISLAIVTIALNVLCRRWVGFDPSVLNVFRKSQAPMGGETAFAGGKFANSKSQG
jgi:O-antigen/teichoic acid export membrane protein